MDIRKVKAGKWGRYNTDRLIRILRTKDDGRQIEVEYTDSPHDRPSTTWVSLSEITAVYDNEFRSWEEAHDIVKIIINQD